MRNLSYFIVFVFISFSFSAAPRFAHVAELDQEIIWQAAHSAKDE
jgi:hypothetical protein